MDQRGSTTPSPQDEAFRPSSVICLFCDLLLLTIASLFGGDVGDFVRWSCRIPQALFRYFVDWFRTSHYAREVLIFAAKRGSIFLTQRLLDAGVDVQWKSDFWVEKQPGSRRWNRDSKEHPISYASRLGHTAVVDLLLQHGADIEYQDREGCSPLLLATRYNRVPVARLLVSQGANLLSTGLWGHCPIGVALDNGYETLLEILLAALEAPGHPPAYVQQGLQGLLQAASRGGHVKWIQYALARGADVNGRKSQYEPTPLLLAVRSATPATVRLLLENGADPNETMPPQPGLRWPSENASPLLVAISNNTWSEPIVHLLLEYGASTRGSDAYFALVRAAESEAVAIFRLLLEHGAPLHHASSRVPTLMSTALASGQMSLVELLLEKGIAPVEERSMDASLVHSPAAHAGEREG